MKPNDFSQMNVIETLIHDTPAPVSARDSLLREERHPNSVTAPPVNRGSMAPRPWRGFWNSIGTAMLVKLGAAGPRAAAPAGAPAAQPWQRAGQRHRA